jgi:hypothetical protein
MMSRVPNFPHVFHTSCYRAAGGQKNESAAADDAWERDRQRRLLPAEPIIEKANLVQAGTSVIVTRTDVDTGDRPQTTASETARNEERLKFDSNGSRRCVIKISASPASGHYV